MEAIADIGDKLVVCYRLVDRKMPFCNSSMKRSTKSDCTIAESTYLVGMVFGSSLGNCSVFIIESTFQFYSVFESCWVKCTVSVIE